MIYGIPNRPLYFYQKDIIAPHGIRSVVVQVFPVQSVSPPQPAARQVIDIMKCGVRQGTKPAVERCGTRRKHEDEPVLMKTAGGFAGMVEKRQQTTENAHWFAIICP